jgi:hypothetical protein
MNRRVISPSVFIAVVALAMLAYFQILAPTVSRARQVRTCADMQSLRDILASYYQKYGRYPDSLRLAISEFVAPSSRSYLNRGIDAWGNALYYESQGSGSAYVLVSYGRDGRPDFDVAYWWIRSTYTDRPYAPEACRTFDADIIASDVAFHRTCGK